jgi:pyruvyl transferase EpsO
LLHGGGSLGDLWYSHQQFREHIIQTHPHRPIVILPQSLYFQKADNLAKAARIFNAHPDLTIFARDDRSFAIATQAFDACRVLKAPDMAFYLTQLAAFPVPPSSPQSILYHCRRDSELDPAFLPEQLGLSNLQVKDWHAYEDRWLLGHPHSPLRQRIARGIRAVWQRGLQHPHEWQSRQIWQRHYTPSFANCYQPELHQLSWSFIHSGIYQMRQYRAVITNRLHGHIFCVLLGIPHIFLPNAYYKNAAFYHSWTAHIPYCRFVTEPDDVKPALEALLAEAPSPTPSNYPPSAGRSRG